MRFSPPADVSQEEDRRSSEAIRFFRRGCCSCSSSVDVWLQNTSYGIANHFLWRSLIVLFTILLLIGPPCQLWFIPKSGDTTMDVLYLLGFVIFVTDMVFNFYLDPKYFPCAFCDRKGLHLKNKTNNFNHQRPCFPCGSLGSFNFWCDFLSTICFLTEVSFIFTKHFSQTVNVVILNEFGFPDPGAFATATDTNGPFFGPDDINLIILIFKTARVARLVPPTKVVDLAGRINFYWYLVRLTPCFYWKLFLERRAGAKRVNKEIKVKKNTSMPRPSWGGLETATIATMKAMKEKERKMKEKGKVVYVGYMLQKLAENTLRFLRILPNTNIELNRQIAATRIQRAWRNRHAKYTEPRSEEGEGSQAWMSIRDPAPSLHLVEGQGPRSRMGDSNHRVSKAEISALNLKRRRDKKADPSRVGTAMAELTGQRVALFLLASLLLVLVFTYTEIDTTDASTMVILHGQTSTGPKGFSLKAVDTARRTTIPNLYSYSYTSTYSKNDINLNWTYGDITDMQDMRDWEIKNITVKDEFGQSTGLFSMKQQVVSSSHMELALLVFVLLTWFFGVAAFAGPIMTLVIIPIERAVKLLSMLVMDPLGYRNTLQYKNFLLEADQIATNGRWTREVLKGMETEFLMSTIVRIGSLMKVGFGSAGVQIIRNNLQKGHSKDTGTLILNSRGTMVSCIFLFCDIRGFTDATECLQEEVFVFTNRVAAVVHSICNSYGGSANKNIGDAFLVSWKLGDSSCEPRGSSRCSHCDTASRHQADKALLSVVKICIALHHNDYYVEMMSDHAKKSLLNKLKDRPGPTVQLGFGLHAGKAVEGAIGSQRKIDATYVSEAVETSEYLETSTKKYKVQMLMSGSFHRLLQPSRRQRCRKIDQVVFENEDDEFYEEGYNQGDRMELFTYDIDVDALWDDTENNDDDDDDSLSDSDDSAVISSSTRDAHRNGLLRLSKRNGSGRSIGSSSRNSHDGTRSNSLSSRGADNQNITAAIAAAAAKAMRASPTMHTEPDERENKSSRKKKKTPELVLPTGPALYSENIWLQADMRRIRRRYTTDIFDTFNVGLQKYYSKDWNEAKVRFEAILDRFEDGPSKYFLDEMSKHDGIPPTNFQAFGKA